MNKLRRAAAILLLLPTLALAETSWIRSPQTVRPGQNSLFAFRTDAATYSVSVETEDGSRGWLSVGAKSHEGENAFWWDGRINGVSLPQGSAAITVTADGESVSVPLTIGTAVPVLAVLDAPEELSFAWQATVTCSSGGTLTLQVNGETVASTQVQPGENTIAWDGRVNGHLLPPGSYELTFLLTDEAGLSAVPSLVDVLLPESMLPQPARDAYPVYPNRQSELRCDHEVCYWNTACGDLNEERIWQLLTQPVTVLKGKQRDQIKVRAVASSNCTDYVGEVTCDSQAVHVLQTQGEWTMIEAYSSSWQGSRVANYAGHFQGWVQTSLLQQKKVNQTIGIVIDKLQQRLYVFRNGSLYTTLLCSTGFPGNKLENPWNETPAGEFLMVSRTGGFYSNDMYCDYALRINSGILLHEVPCYLRTREDGTQYKYYSVFPDYLGEKASHGCIRIQAEKSPEGISMQWFWGNLPVNAKVIIWDELDRELVSAQDDYVLYYNKKGGRMYHSSANCLYVDQRYRPLAAFTWGELQDKAFQKLTRCPACAPQLRESEVETVNRKNIRTANP